MMGRFDGPLWRIAGSFVSWLVFTLSFSLLYMGSATVMGLGGFCASGGPYVIETECPEAVITFVPLSIFTGLAAVAVGAIFARGFGTPLVSWAWPVLFVGLGAAFLISSAAPGGITFLFIGLMFLVMGAVPLVLELRASAQALFLGTTNAAGETFQTSDRARGTAVLFRRRGAGEPDTVVPPTAGDWALSLGILIAAVLLGIYLASLLWQAAGG
jgi:hypothetical protein